MFAYRACHNIYSRGNNRSLKREMNTKNVYCTDPLCRNNVSLVGNTQSSAPNNKHHQRKKPPHSSVHIHIQILESPHQPKLNNPQHSSGKKPKINFGTGKKLLFFGFTALAEIAQKDVHQAIDVLRLYLEENTPWFPLFQTDVLSVSQAWHQCTEPHWKGGL